MEQIEISINDSPSEWTSLGHSPDHRSSLWHHMHVLSRSPEVVEGSDSEVIGGVEHHHVAKGGVGWGSSKTMY